MGQSGSHTPTPITIKINDFNMQMYFLVCLCLGFYTPACSVSPSPCRPTAWSALLPSSLPCSSSSSSPSSPSAGKWPREWGPACLFSTSSSWRYRLDSSTDSWCVPSKQTNNDNDNNNWKKRSQISERKKIFRVWTENKIRTRKHF